MLKDLLQSVLVIVIGGVFTGLLGRTPNGDGTGYIMYAVLYLSGVVWLAAARIRAQAEDNGDGEMEEDEEAD